MKAVVISQYGSNDVVQRVDIDRPQPGAGEILLRVQAAGVNPVDWKIRDGMGERLGLSLPIHLGGELVGIVEDLGAGVDGFQTGDMVYGMVRSGAFAEFAVAKAADMVRTPANLGALEAAALPLAGSTAWQALFDEAKLTAGQRLLVTNSSGGVGSLAVQFAKAKGAHVTALASTRNEAFVRMLGADTVVDYTRERFESVVSDMDVVLDTVGGETFHRAFRTLRPKGLMVTVVAFPSDEAERFDVQVIRTFTTPSGPNLGTLTDLVEAGTATPHVEAVFPLSDIRQALALSGAGRVRGKIVLSVPD